MDHINALRDLPIKCHLPDCRHFLRSFRFHDHRIRGCCRRAAEEGLPKVSEAGYSLYSIHGRARVYTSVNTTAETRSTRGRFASTSPVKLRREHLRKYLEMFASLVDSAAMLPALEEKSRWRVDRQTHPPHHASAPAPPRCNVSQSLDLCACRRALTLEHLMSSYCGYVQAVWPQRPSTASGTTGNGSDLHGQHNRGVRASLVLPSEKKKGGSGFSFCIREPYHAQYIARQPEHYKPRGFVDVHAA